MCVKKPEVQEDSILAFFFVWEEEIVSQFLNICH